MKTLDKGQDKVQQICDSLRRETLEPAKIEAERIIEEARERARQIIHEAHEQAERHHATARAEIEQERNVFNSSLAQAAKQTIETLRQSVEDKIFNSELEELVARESSNENVIAELIKAIVKAVETEGIDANLEVFISKSASPKAVAAHLGESILKKLKDHTVQVGEFEGGAQVKLVGKKMTIDITDSTLKELMANFVRKDFRKMIFAN